MHTFTKWSLQIILFLGNYIFFIMQSLNHLEVLTVLHLWMLKYFTRLGNYISGLLFVLTISVAKQACEATHSHPFSRSPLVLSSLKTPLTTPRHAAKENRWNYTYLQRECDRGMLTKIGLEITQQESNTEILNTENQLIITKDRSKIPKTKKGNLKHPNNSYKWKYLKNQPLTGKNFFPGKA